MPGLTAKVIGAAGNMGREHVAAFQGAGVSVLDADDTDIVSIASPDNTHAQYAIEALRKGQHVFCEKPVATTPKDFRDVILAGQDSGSVLWQHFPLRYQALFVGLKDKMEDFGEIYRIEASYNWGRTEKLFEGWRKTDEDYSLVMGGMIHMIDLVIWLTGQIIVPCSACAIDTVGRKRWDTVTAIAQLENQAICVLTVDGGRGVKEHHHRVLVHGNKGGMTVVNHEPSNKHAMILDFVKELGKKKPRNRGLFATSVALNINEQIHAGAICDPDD